MEDESELSAQTGERYLSDVLSTCAGIDTSVARRMIVMGQVKVNGDVVDDPSARLCNEPGFPSLIDYADKIYPFYP